MKVAYNIASNYKLYNSVLFNSRTTLYIFNNLTRFISKIEPTTDYIYVGIYIKKIINFKIAIVTLNTPKGKEQILLIGAA